MRFKEPMLSGLVGILVVASLMGNNLLVSSSQTIIFFVILIGASIGFVIYSLWRKHLPNG